MGKRQEYRVIVSNEPERMIASMARKSWRLVAAVGLGEDLRELYFRRAKDDVEAMVAELTRDSSASQVVVS